MSGPQAAEQGKGRRKAPNARCLFAPFFLMVVLMANSASQSQPPQGAQDDDRYWVDAMKKVHARFTGRKGTFAHFGDSITVTMAFWAPLADARKNAPPEMERAFPVVSRYMQKDCWREWKGPRFGNEGSMTIRWAHENVDKWLKTLNPEVALIMFGTNDLHSLSLEEHTTQLREVVQKCLANGTVVILSTIPPRHGSAEKAEAFANAQRRVARELKIPLTDYHREILKRRPDDWDGAADTFKSYEGYDVPTLLARDGVHPSHPKNYQDDYSQEALSKCGFSLRNYLVLTAYADVLDALDLIALP